MKRLLGCLILLGLISAASAEMKIDGEPKVAAYKLVRLSVSGAADDAAIIWDIDREDLADVAEIERGIVFSAPPGSYRVKARSVRLKDGKVLIETARLTVTIDGGVIPTPPDPPPTPTPTPTPASGPFWLLVIEETGEASGARGDFFANKELRSRIVTKSHKYRVADKDVKGRDGKPPPDMAPWLDRTKGKKLPWLYIIDAKGNIAFDAEMVRTPADLIKLLDKLGG